ncbi:MAG: hypothetical protein PHQ76_01525 [Caldisericia bacterium]|nr:hypothetical protein [Caldisericia bacterium]
MNNQNNTKSFWDYFNMHRRDSGWLRFFVVLFFIILDYYVFKYAYLLTLKGVQGEFQIAVESSEWSFYFTSIAPGLFFVLVGGIIIWVLPKTLKSLIES